MNQNWQLLTTCLLIAKSEFLNQTSSRFFINFDYFLKISDRSDGSAPFPFQADDQTGETRSVSRERYPGAEGFVVDFGSPMAGETRYDGKRSFIEVVRVDPGNTHLPGGDADFELDHHLCEFATIDQHDSLNRTSKLDGLGSER